MAQTELACCSERPAALDRRRTAGHSRTFLIHCTAAATLTVSSSFAFAADMAPVLRAPPVPAIDSWTGFYISATVGYGWSSGASTIVPNAAEVNKGAGDPVFMAQLDSRMATRRRR